MEAEYFYGATQDEVNDDLSSTMENLSNETFNVAWASDVLESQSDAEDWIENRATYYGDAYGAAYQRGNEVRFVAMAVYDED